MASLTTTMRFFDISGIQETSLTMMRTMLTDSLNALQLLTKPVEGGLTVSNSGIEEFMTDAEKNMGSLLLNIAQLWADRFSEEEMQALIAFYQTPEGASVMAKMPAISADAAKIGMEWGQQLGKGIKRLLS